MRTFGLTGGIGSGKSEVARRFAQRGVPVVDADTLAREVVAPGSEGLSAIVQAFGSGYIDASGHLDRRGIARVVFADQAARDRLNRIVHPRVARLAEQRLADLAGRGNALVCYEAPLLVETGNASAFRPLVVVAAPESLQVLRAMRRDDAREDEVTARIRAQLPLEEKAKMADFVIDNSGTLEELAAASDEALRFVCRATSVSASPYNLDGGSGRGDR